MATMRLPSYRYCEYPVLTASKCDRVLQLLGPYVLGGELRSLCSVSKLCRALFLPRIWRDPANLVIQSCSLDHERESAVGTASAASAAKWYSLYHALRMPSAIPSAIQLIEILRLNQDFILDLGSLRISNPEVLLAKLRYLKVLIYEASRSDSIHKNGTTFRLSLDNFRAADASNLYVLSLPRLKNHFQDVEELLRSHGYALLFLDLSYVPSSERLLRSLENNCPNVAILKLAGSLKNSDRFRAFWNGLNARPFSLDISDNSFRDDILIMLSDRIARSRKTPAVNLSNFATSYLVQAPQYTVHSEWGLDGNRIAASGSDRFSIDEYEHEYVDYREDTLTSTMNFLTRHGFLDHLDGYSPAELVTHNNQLLEYDASVLNTALSARSGITHLYVGGNRFTENALMRTLAGTGLQHLDLGLGKYSQKYVQAQDWQVRTCGLEFATTISANNFQRLEYLRVHHSFITFVGRASTHGRSTPSRTSIFVQEKCMRIAPTRRFDINTLPSLRVLVLVDIPRQTYGNVTERLRSLLKQAAMQERLIQRLHQQVPSTTRRGQPLWSGLRILRLEMENEEAGLPAESITEDEDARGFHEQMHASHDQLESEGDFSFFNWTATGDAVLEGCGSVPDLALMDVLGELRHFRQSQSPRWLGKIEILDGSTR